MARDKNAAPVIELDQDHMPMGIWRAEILEHILRELRLLNIQMSTLTGDELTGEDLEEDP